MIRIKPNTPIDLSKTTIMYDQPPLCLYLDTSIGNMILFINDMPYACSLNSIVAPEYGIIIFSSPMIVNDYRLQGIKAYVPYQIIKEVSSDK